MIDLDIEKEFENFHVHKRISGFSKEYAKVYFNEGARVVLKIAKDLNVKRNDLIFNQEKKINKLEGVVAQLKKEVSELSK